MLRYFFHLTENDRALADEEGMLLTDDSAVRPEAIKQIRSMVAQEMRETGEIHLARRIDITDVHGRTIERVVFNDALQIRE